jgi:hypothetical protein
MTEEAQQPKRDEKGRILPGSPPLNPTGENGTKGLPDLMTRQEYFETHYTVSDLQKLINDKDRFGQLSLTDAQIVTHLAATIAGGKERGKERERYYDRKYGRPVQETRLTGKDGKSLFASDRDALRRRLLSPVAAAGTGSASGSDDGSGDDDPTV